MVDPSAGKGLGSSFSVVLFNKIYLEGVQMKFEANFATGVKFFPCCQNLKRNVFARIFALIATLAALGIAPQAMAMQDSKNPNLVRGPIRTSLQSIRKQFADESFDGGEKFQSEVAKSIQKNGALIPSDCKIELVVGMKVVAVVAEPSGMRNVAQGDVGIALSSASTGEILVHWLGKHNGHDGMGNAANPKTINEGESRWFVQCNEIQPLTASDSPNFDITLDFVGMQQFESVVGFYDGGLASFGSGPGPSYGAKFSNNSRVYYAYNGSNEPSPGVVAPLLTDRVVIDLNYTIKDISFMYSSTVTVQISAYSGLNGTGDLVGSTSFSQNTNGPQFNRYNTWSQFDFRWANGARSIVFDGLGNNWALDSVQFTNCPDSDGDGVGDCKDGCPADPAKTEPGQCGCGVADTDSDSDGTADCNDGCPADANKIAPGICGCGVADTDTDSDGTADCNDGCPADANKTAPGICGCGVADTDTDSDGTADCNDGCPVDANKTAPGICGCGVADTDTDSDGTADCNDGCPADANKTAPGICGCGVADTDTDSDGTADCNDGCPADANKIAPGICGCGVADTDTDSDGTADCNDGCPADANKTAPGICGCGVADTDTDSDGTADCNDGCPADANKTAPGICGCGVADTDTDSDGTADCNDGCPADAYKTAPGICGCGVADTDTDSDGTADCNDGCPADANKIAPGICGCGVADTDTDSDGTADCNDGCPADANKIAPGICGCGVADTDTDSDGTADCNDGCPADANKIAPGICGCGVADTDTDSDGTADCNDGCPADANKTAPGICGCGVADTDTDSDGTADCNDNCVLIANPGQEDCNGNDIGDTCDIASGQALDCNANNIPDSCDIASGSSADGDNDGIPDVCEPTPAIQLVVVGSPACVTAPGSEVSYELHVVNPPFGLIAGQFFVEWDTATFALANVSAGDAPFTSIPFTSVNAGTGRVFLITSVAGGGTGTSESRIVARLHFQALTVNCSPTIPQVRFMAASPQILTNGQGGSATLPLTNPIPVRIDGIAPVITGTPASITVDADAIPGCSSQQTVIPPTASDNCEVSSFTFSRSDGQSISAPFPCGTTTMTWVATDPC